MNALCVGGPADGRRVVLQDGIKHYDVIITEPVDFNAAVDPRQFVTSRFERYNWFPLHPVTRAAIFAHIDLTPTEIMEALMDGYRAEKVR